MARGESISKPTNLSLDQRRQIFDKTVAKVTKHYFDPNFNGTEWPKRARDSEMPFYRPAILMNSSYACTIWSAASKAAIPDSSISPYGGFPAGWTDGRIRYSCF